MKKRIVKIYPLFFFSTLIQIVLELYNGRTFTLFDIISNILFSSDVVLQEVEIVEEFPSAVLTADEYDYTTGILPLYIREIDDKGKGVSSVNVAVWVDDDQSDIQWMQAESMGDGTYLMNISVPDFEYKVGEYKIDAYMVADQGTQHLLGSTVGHVE